MVLDICPEEKWNIAPMCKKHMSSVFVYLSLFDYSRHFYVLLRHGLAETAVILLCMSVNYAAKCEI